MSLPCSICEIPSLVYEYQVNYLHWSFKSTTRRGVVGQM